MASEIIHGKAALERRMMAVSGAAGAKLMRKLGLSAVREQKLLVHRKTGNLGRSIRLGAVTERSVATIAGANYARPVEFGANIPEITPKAARVLAWAKGSAGGSFQRLSGAPRTGIGRSGMIFAMRTRAHRNKPYPFMVPGAKRAIEKGGLKDVVIDAWNGAA